MSKLLYYNPLKSPNKCCSNFTASGLIKGNRWVFWPPVDFTHQYFPPLPLSICIYYTPERLCLIRPGFVPLMIQGCMQTLVKGFREPELVVTPG